MRKIYYSPFFSCSRDMLVEKCVEVLKKGQKVIYILPSREAMFDVREKFIEGYGGIADAYIFGFDDFEQLLCKDIIKSSNIVRESTIYFIIRHILSPIGEDEFYGRVKDKPGFIKAVYRFIKRLKRMNLTPDEYGELIKSLNGILKIKCEFLNKIYREYERYKSENNIIDIDDISNMACDAACNSEILSQTGILIVDGFINMDHINKKLLKTIIECAPGLDMIASIPYKNENNEEFIKNEMLKDLLDLGFNLEEFNGGCKPVNPHIKLLSENLYCGTKVFRNTAPGISISNSPCIEHEVREAARIIKKRIVDGEVVPERAALYIKNIDEYRETIQDVFSEMGIPVFMHSGDKLISVPLTRDILSLLIYDLKGREAEGFKNIISSKYLIPNDILYKMDYETERILKLAEDACKKNEPGEFVNKLYYLLSSNTELEAVRDDLKGYMNQVFSFRPHSCQSIYECIEDYKEIIGSLNIRNKIIMLYNRGLLDGEGFIRDLKAIEKIEEVLDEMLTICSTISISSGSELSDELYRILVDLFSSVDIGMRYTDLGGVKVLNPDLARGQTYDMVFLLGVNEGIFPGVQNGSPLFDSLEDDMLMNSGINNINHHWELEREKIRFNMCIGSALKEVHISYRTCDEDGGYMIKSPLVDEVISLMGEDKSKFMMQPVYMRDRFNFDGETASCDEGIRNITNTVWNKKGTGLGKIEYVNKLYGNDEIKKRIDYIIHGGEVEFARMEDPVFDKYDGRLESAELSQKDSDYGFSPSQLNSYAYCPFMYFSERVLGLSEIEEEEPLDVKSVGRFYHEVLKEYYDNNDRFDTFDKTRLKAIFDCKVKNIIDESMPDILLQCVSDELYSVLEYFLQNDAYNLKIYQGSTGLRMKPVLLEHPFELKGVMGGATIKGIVDRVDLEIRDDGSYTGRFIIYDYKKSGIKSIRECVDGEDFQLAIYYMAISRYLKGELKIKEPQCLALIYYSIQTGERKGIIRSDAKKYLFEGRKGPRDLVGAANLDALMDWVDENGAEVIKSIRRGEFYLPAECFRENGAYKCIFKPMCRFDKYRVSDKRRVPIND